MIVVVAAIVALGCGGGSSAADDEALIDAIVGAADVADEDLSDLGLDLRCLAESLVAAVGGAEGAEEDYGVTVERVEADPDFDLDLTREDADSMADRFWDCGGLAEPFVQGMTSVGVERADAECVIGNLPEDVMKDNFAAEMMGDAGLDQVAETDALLDEAFEGALADCDVDLFG